MPRKPKSHLRRDEVPTSAQTDQELVEGIRLARESHFNELYRRYFRRIYNFTHSRVRNRADAEEITQEVFTSVFRSIEAFKGNSALLTWIFGIARNTINNFISASQARMSRDGEKARELSGISLPEINEIAERQWKLFIAKKAMQNVSRDFSDKVFDVFLRFSRGEKSSLISMETGLAENTVHVYSSRVQKALKKEIVRLESQLN